MVIKLKMQPKTKNQFWTNNFFWQEQHKTLITDEMYSGQPFPKLFMLESNIVFF